MQTPAVTPDPRWTQSHYLVKKVLLKLLGSAFMVYDPQGRLVFYIQQKAFKIREDITVYADEKKQYPMLNIKARQIMDFSAAYDVVDMMTGEKVGMLRRKGWRSIARDEWDVCGPNDQPFATLIEDALWIALIRRFLSNLVPQNYDMLIGGQRVVDYAQNFNPFTYHLKLDFTHDRANQVDRRLGIAAAVLLAVIEGRQR